MKPIEINKSKLGEIGFSMKLAVLGNGEEYISISKDLWLRIADRLMKEQEKSVN